MTVVGLGIEGIDLTRFLAAEGARVTVSDIRGREELTEALAAIEGTDAILSLGANREEDMTGADCVFVSQGVPPELPALRAARRVGVPLSSMTRLFLERCPAPVAGITGSSGKTTTTALVGDMLAEAGEDYVVGGNIGVGLLALLERIGPDTRVVLELSHTQLESIEQSPQLACVTNVTPNHLDRYSWASYVALKRRIFEYQREDDLAIFHIDDEVAAAFAEEAPAARALHLPAASAARRRRDRLRRDRGAPRGRTRDGADGPRRDPAARRPQRRERRLRARHRLGAWRRGRGGRRGRAPLPGRTAPPRAGRDRARGCSTSTTRSRRRPERALAGMRTYREPLVLLLGGRDKHLPLGELAREAVERCRAVVGFGEAGPIFAEAVAGARDGERPVIEQAGSIEEAVAAAARLARAGDVVLCAPAGTSFDAYRNFEQRGAAFRDAVEALRGSD